MIGAWLLYCVLVSALLGLAAWVVESAARAQGWGGRWGWALALAGSLGLPLTAWLRPASAPASSSGPLPMPGTYLMESLPAVAAAPGAGAGPSFEVLVLVAWAAVSAGLLLYLAVSAVRVVLEGRRWRRGEVDGMEVLVSEATGPAALGLFRGWIVLPEWALTLDQRLRRLLVLHEAEHVRAKDPQLAVAGLVACALVPWNLPLWWQLSRLRLAIELDCDDRVMRRAGDAASYGSLLLAVGQRRARLAVGLAESRSILERRIRMITRTTTRRRTARALALGGVSALVLAVACETPAPTGIADTASRPLAPEQALAETRAMPCDPAVYVNGEEASHAVLDAIVPDEIEAVDVIKGASPDCGAVLILMKDAPPAAVERHRRVVETLQAARSPARDQVTLEDVQEAPTFTPMTVRPTLTNARDAGAAIRANYPPLLRNAGIEGTAEVWLLIDDEGVVRQAQIHQGTGHDALDQAALRVARSLEFTPAYNRDVRVPVWIVLPITFETDG